MTFLTARMLPAGRSILADHDFDRRLHEGDPTVGWVGDPRLGVVYNGDTDRIELWRYCEDGEARKITQSRPGVRVLDSDVLRFLAEHDPLSRRAYNVNADIAAHNAKVRSRQAADLQAREEAAADRLQWALRKDIGAYEGGSRHIYQKLPAAPWKDADA